MKTNLVVLTLCLMGCGLAPVDEIVTPALVVEQAQPVAPAPEPRRHLPAELRTVLSDVTSPISLLLTQDTVFCSAIGYGLSFLKVSIPQLDQLAHFDHRVEEAGLPCAAVGACDEELGPQSVLQGNPGVENVSVRVVLTEVIRIDEAEGTCSRQLLEDVFTTVRGNELRHHEEDEPSPMRFDDCRAIARSRGL
ncbi:MAG TPA: hypothetical protein VGD87_02795 [Archangium sp.]